MEPRVLIDSNIVIDVLAGHERARQTIREYPDRGISIITWIEVVAGLQPNQSRVKDDLAKSFIVLPLTMEIAEEASKLRRTTRLKLPDATILATAHVEKRVLLTRNTRDFVAGRFVSFPYSL